MSSILIPATKSLTVTNKFPNENINNETIIVGNDGMHSYISYLFFDISAIPSNCSISSAELVLFKQNNFYDDSGIKFTVLPLQDYFSTYTTFNNRPRVNCIIKESFYPITSKVAVTVDLTYFVSLWVKNKLSTTGISLFDKNNSIITKFGSSICKNTYLTPFIKVNICNECNDLKKPNCNHSGASIRKVRVIGTVAKNSQYEAIVNIGVKRRGTGRIDNYYVADEYSNLLGSKSLHINKIYNIAIIPKKKPGDVETIDLYGSYKG